MEALKEIGIQSKNDIIALLVVLGIIAIAALPTIKVLIKAGEKKRDQYFKREQLLVDVVKENSTVISELTTLIKNNNRSCDECKREQIDAIDGLRDMMLAISGKQDNTLMLMQSIQGYAAAEHDNKQV